MMRTIAFLWMGIAAVSVSPILAADAQIAPPAGYSGSGARLGGAAPTGFDATMLTRLPDSTLMDVFRVNPDYKRGGATGHIKVVGAFEIAETQKRHLLAAWSPGFLPVTLSFSDGRCYSLQADYINGSLSNGRLSNAGCDGRQADDKPPTPSPGFPLKFVGSAWGYAAWANERIGNTLITAPYAKTFQPLFTAQMETIAIMAMNGPDFPGGNVTLVGRIKKRLIVVTLEVGY